MTNASLPKSFTWLNLTQFFGALNDNLLKLLIIFFLIALKGPEHATAVAATTGAMFVVPFLLFSPIAGALADKLSKKTIILGTKIMEVGIGLLGITAFSLSSAAGLYAVMFLMATQSALFGPSKYGIVPEIVDREQLSKANSLIESFTYIAIILGSAIAPFLVQVSAGDYRMAAQSCILFSLLGLAASWKIKKTAPADTSRSISPKILSEMKQSLDELRHDKYLLAAILGSAYFLFLGAFAQINLIPFGMEVHHLTQEQAGYLFLVSALGIGLGSLLSGRLSGRNVEFGVVPLGALGLALCSTGLFLLPNSLPVHVVLILLFGISAGLFLVPLHAFVQFRAPRDSLGRILAAGSFLSWCGVLVASGLSAFLSGALGFSAAQSFLVLGLLTFGLTIVSLWILPDFLLRFVTLLTMRVIYRLRVVGGENVPSEGPALLVSNHASWIDALLLLATQQRRIRFIMHQDIYKVRLLQPLFKMMGVIPVVPRGSKKQIVKFIKASRKALEDGYLVCIFAEGMITRNGMLHQFQSGLETILRGSNHPVIPIYLGGAWGTIFSYAHGKPFSKLPTSFPYTVSIHFGTPMQSTSKSADVQQAVAELAHDYYEDQRSKRTSLSEMFIKSARSNWNRKAISDSSGMQLSYGKALCGSLALSDQLKTKLDDSEMVGLLLPSSVGGALANLAVPMTGKVPVNINYTASPEAVQSAYAQCGITTLITSKKFLERFPQIPMPANVICLEDLIGTLDWKEKLNLLLRARLLPIRMILQVARSQGENLATVIFSSGSTGEPKGVQLSQHNIISNLEAIRTVAAISPKDNVCSALPFFHALGFTATLWLPLLSGFSASYHVNPMEAAAITKLVRKQKSTLLLTTPTFLATYMRRAKKEDFASLRLVVTGAEKLKSQVADSFEQKYGIRPLEGYGATELAPLITLSLPNVNMNGVKQAGNKAGSVGRPIPGVVLKVVDPDTNEPLPLGESGLILVKGPNLMTGYLNRPDKTAEAIQDGWYLTGDIGNVDDGGFLHITDRLARFSKIGGEMVPHVKVEEIFYRELKLEGNALAVTSIPDEKKGEKLVVLYTDEAGETEELKRVSLEADLPNLWRPHPDNFVWVEQIPILGTGKMDLQSLRRLAEAAM